MNAGADLRRCCDERGRSPDLPALVRRAVVGVVFGDVGVDAAESQLFVRGRRDGLDDQLSVGIRRFGLVLDKHTWMLTHTPPPVLTALPGVGNHVSGASPWGFRPPPPHRAARSPHLSARPGFASAQKRLWQHIRLLTGGQRSRCVHSDTLTTPLPVDWPDRNWEH